MTGLMGKKLTYHSLYDSTLLETPYAIFTDLEQNAVVISIRGTMSLDDCIVDGLAEPVSASDYGKRWGFNGDTMSVHKGALERAEWVRQV